MMTSTHLICIIGNFLLATMRKFDYFGEVEQLYRILTVTVYTCLEYFRLVFFFITSLFPTTQQIRIVCIYRKSARSKIT